MVEGEVGGGKRGRKGVRGREREWGRVWGKGIDKGGGK